MEVVLEKYLDLEKRIEAQNPSFNIKLLRSAFDFASEAHKGQLRKDGSPFITHPLAAAEITFEMGLDEDSIIACLLHDCIEDTSVTYEDIAKLFGKSVAELVSGVTKLTRVVYTNKEDEQMENLRKMLMAMAKDIRVILIKIADRLHNMRTMNWQTADKQKEKALETMEIYAPIAHRLGMQKIKWELEDLSLLYLDPFGYNEINESLKSLRQTYGEFMDSVSARITERLTEAGIECSVKSRMKHVYSIYRKMYSQNKELTEVFDLFAFRVIVNTIADCYNVLGQIHDLFKPIIGRFKDYIGTPKPNMYQSLHTTVIGSEGIPFEVQIRTWEMHQTAEYGIAAHWKYKQGLDGKTADEEIFAWIRRLLEAQQDSDAQDFFHDLKMDMFADEVFVFTPKGDVINLPVGATPIDFAYNIHSAIGNRMTGATVNGRIVPFDHKLQNGDIVEVLTSNSSKGPSRDWLSIARSSEARSKIKQWFKKERREENIQHGRESFESEMRRNNLPMSALNQEDILPIILKKFSAATIEDLYAAIGYGGVTALRAVNRLKDELSRLAKPIFKTPIEKLNATVVKEPAPSVSGIVVEGISNCLVKFSRCCTPVPGDDIIGFITRGYGVSIHRRDCQNYLSSLSKPEDAGRWVSVHWSVSGEDKYQTALAISATDRSGLIVDIATVLNAIKAKVRSLSAKEAGEGRAVVFISTEVKSREELDYAIKRLYSIPGVIEITRAGAQP